MKSHLRHLNLKPLAPQSHYTDTQFLY